MLAGDSVRLTFKPYLQYTSDRLCPSVDQIQSDDLQTGMTNPGSTTMAKPGSGSLSSKDESAICKAFDPTRNTHGGYQLPGSGPTNHPFGQMDPRERFGTTRLMLQGVLEVAASNNTNFWLLVEDAPGQDQRQQLTSKFNSAFTDNDFPFYVRFGVTLKF